MINQTMTVQEKPDEKIIEEEKERIWKTYNIHPYEAIGGEEAHNLFDEILKHFLKQYKQKLLETLEMDPEFRIPELIRLSRI